MTVSYQIEICRPEKVFGAYCQLDEFPWWISGCSIPGIDPTKKRKKQCQDNVFYIPNKLGILACLFDGHGQFGREIVKFWEDVTRPYFEQHKIVINDTPEAGIEKLIAFIETKLQLSEIDIKYSGTTWIFVYVNSKGITVGSVGDSRAISNDQECLQQLTVDCKPQDPEESKRIKDRRGSIKQLPDIDGNLDGPFRVFESGTQKPGLAMSRSLGDSKGKEIGIIADPIIKSYPLIETEGFIVLASDGIWDMLSNEEVVELVDRARTQVPRELRRSLSSCATLTDINISMVLSELARTKWIELVEKEGLCIDDISCIVLEFLPRIPEVGEISFAESSYIF